MSYLVSSQHGDVTMMSPALFHAMRAGLVLAVMTAPAAADAQQPPADRQDAALAYAQCVRDHGYAEFPDPTPDGFRFLIDPQNVSRFKKAADACRNLAPEGLRDEGVSPETLDALLKLSQCIRENGIPDFPDPDAKGTFDLSSVSSGPGDARVKAAMAACDKAGLGKGGRIVIGG
jgi:hypothetical protein